MNTAMSVYHGVFESGPDEADSQKCMLEDLQLAAELGKTLLERNKELETTLRNNQTTIEEQAQEIEYLTKKSTALREVNDSRLRIYEKLEVSILEIEHTNHTLVVERSADKNQIKNLTQNVDNLELKCDELHRTIEELSHQLQVQRRRNERVLHSTSSVETSTGGLAKVQDAQANKQEKIESDSSKVSAPEDVTDGSTCTSMGHMQASATLTSGNDEEEMIQILQELRDTRSEFAAAQCRVADLELELASMVTENKSLRDMLRSTPRDEEMKSVQDELNSICEDMQSHLCRKCSQNMDSINPEDMSSIGAYEDDDRSVRSFISNFTDSPLHRGSMRGSTTMQIKISPKDSQPGNEEPNSYTIYNPYRDLVEKYEALLEVQRLPRPTTNQNSSLPQNEDLQSGDFSSINTKDTDEESGNGEDNKNKIKNQAQNLNRKLLSRTPTDFSEAETSSSGFSDETSNKATQTEERAGSFLCTIADGEDCRFSIYDDASPIDSRFRNRPKYRELFKEIFTVLKKAAENKDEGEKLPLLDDVTPVKVPPVTPATEEQPGDFTDDTQSIMSSAISEQSVAVSERITAAEKIMRRPSLSKHAETKLQSNVKAELISENTQDAKTSTKPEDPTRVLTPYRRQPLEYLSVGNNIRKKSSSKKHSSRRQVDRSESPIIPTPPKVYYRTNGTSENRKKRREYRPIDNLPRANNLEWNGSSMQFYNKSISSPTPSITSNSGRNWADSSLEFKPSTASQDLNKLKKLELSYAEVLRNADKAKKMARRK